MNTWLKRIGLSLFSAFALSAGAQTHPDSVSFRLSDEQTKTIGDVIEASWTATHESGEGTARFRISLQFPAKRKSGALFSFSKGYFTHIEGSKSAGFLKQLAAALGAKSVPAAHSSLAKLDFAVALFGLAETRTRGGSFTSKPPGSWIVTKIFLAGGEAEVFLNLDPVNKVGEFSMKDEEYGNVVIAELAKVL